jgi:NTE family protein
VERSGPSFFEGLSDADVETILASLERRRFPAGSVVVLEGDTPREMYFMESGQASAFVADRQGIEHLVGAIESGGTIGEMSLFTAQPASATVRADSDLDVVVFNQADFERVATASPRIYRNLGSILSERLARTNRLTLDEQPGRLLLIDDDGASPLLGYSLAASIAWHTRAPTVWVALQDEPAAELEALAGREPGDYRGHAAVLIAPRSGGRFGPDRIREAVNALFADYEYVLMQGAGPEARSLPGAKLFTLSGLEAPEPDATEQQSLRNGWLPAGGPAGAVIGPAARELVGLRVGIALGAGSLRGYAHVGALRVLERAGVPLDLLAGTSVGSVVAGLRALGYPPDETMDILDALGAAMVRPTVPRKGLLSPRALKRFVRNRFGVKLIEDLPIPLAVVTADIATQEEVVLRRGDLGLALLAATAVPGIYPAMRIDRHALVDGGILNPVPTSVAADMGAGAVIGIRLVSADSRSVIDSLAIEGQGPIPSALAAILRSIDLMQTRIAVDTSSAPTIVLSPKFPDMQGAKLRNFRAGRAFVEAGEEAAEAALPRLASVLPWLRA